MIIDNVIYIYRFIICRNYKNSTKDTPTIDAWYIYLHDTNINPLVCMAYIG